MTPSDFVHWLTGFYACGEIVEYINTNKLLIRIKQELQNVDIESEVGDIR